MKKVVTLLIAALINFNSLGQDSKNNHTIDSLLDRIKTLPDDTLKVSTLIELGNNYLYRDITEAFRYGAKARDLATEIEYANGTGYSHKLLGLVSYQQGNYMQAIAQLNVALKAFESVKNEDGESSILNNLGSVYFSAGDENKAIDYHTRALEIAEKSNNRFRISTSLNNIGVIYLGQSNKYKALSFFLRAVPIFEEINYTEGIGIVYINVGEIYFNDGSYDSSVVYFEKANKTYEGTVDATYSLNYLGEIYAFKNMFEKSLFYHNQAIEISERLGAKLELVQSLLSLGKTQEKMGAVSSSIETNKKALKMAEEINARLELKMAYESLSRSYALLRDFDNAFRYEKLLTSIKDTLYNTDGDRKMQRVQFNADIDKLESELQLQQATIQRQKTINYAASISGILLLTIGLVTLRFFQIRKSNREKRKANEILEATLYELKATQAQLIQSEKMASLGELTAGIAHEIQNPLNFVNNFSELNVELINDLNSAIENGNSKEVALIARDLQDNEAKINHHGKRAEAIVKGMLQHSRTSTGVKELIDINALADEYLRLSYHGLRAKDKSFNAKFETHFDTSIPKINVIGQDIGRVILNLINNAFYAVTERKKQAEDGYEPTVSVYTKQSNGKLEICVKDNGIGIPQKVLDKIFQPFFTTKPTGQGTGLGLSLSYDIVKAHGGELQVETKEGVGSEFIVRLPSKA